jgi:hypothetical protein
VPSARFDVIVVFLQWARIPAHARINGGIVFHRQPLDRDVQSFSDTKETQGHEGARLAGGDTDFGMASVGP